MPLGPAASPRAKWSLPWGVWVRHHSKHDRNTLNRGANIAEEILAQLREKGTQLVVKIEIEATDATGFEEGRVRTVSENARTLHFDQSGFENS